MSIVAGISGFRRNAAVALARSGNLAAVCEQGRLSRVRDVGIETGGFPEEALQATIKIAQISRDSLKEMIVAEEGIDLLEQSELHRFDHHLGHAATAFLTSALDEALVLVCDTNTGRELTVWRGANGKLEEVPLGWQGPGFASVYSRLTKGLSLHPGRDEHRVEALARLGCTTDSGRVSSLLRKIENGIEVDPVFDDFVTEALSGGRDAMAAAAGAVQCRLGELLLEFLRDLHKHTALPSICVGGGLFFNTYLNTLLRQSGIFKNVFVPVNPGNAGVSAGCALLYEASRSSVHFEPRLVSPFLGPSFTNEEIKGVLDNCKLSYDFLDDGALLTRTVDALTRGELVGWFRGRLEWGTRALGNRSIFASPFAPYVLENLNQFLKHREAHRTYGLAVRLEDVSLFFEGPLSSPYMECEYTFRNPARFSSVLPLGIDRVRVQTIDSSQPLFRDLLTKFEEATGMPVLVNTSFNGFHEPIVCSPRDAVRVFYGTGLDMLVTGSFVIRK